MNGWIYTHNIDPILVQIGPVRIGWYGVMYALSFLVGYALMLRDARKPDAAIQESEVPNLVTYVILGVVIGGRLGWVLFYGGLPFLEEPWRIVQTWKGGMSFHGGMLGVLLAFWLFSRRNRIGLLQVGDAVVGYIPVGLFFGRIGNFINGELFGKPTDGKWGVIFPGDREHAPRHPSQLYEALLEGLVIFLVLQAFRRVRRPGLQPALFLLLYGLSRFAVEFVRLPDADIGYLWDNWLTMGQVLSLPMIVIGAGWTIFCFARPPAPPLTPR